MPSIPGPPPSWVDHDSGGDSVRQVKNGVQKSHPPALLPPAACSTSHHIPCASFVFEPMEPISLRIKNKNSLLISSLPPSSSYSYSFFLLRAMRKHMQPLWSIIRSCIGRASVASWDLVRLRSTVHGRLSARLRPTVDRQVARWAKLLRGAH